MDKEEEGFKVLGEKKKKEGFKGYEEEKEEKNKLQFYVLLLR